MWDDIIRSVTPLVASGLVWALNKGVGLLAPLPDWAKRGCLLLFAFGYRVGLEAIGFTVPEGAGVDWLIASAEAVVGFLVAWGIYDLGKLAKRPGTLPTLLVLLLAGGQLACERASAGGIDSIAMVGTGVVQGDSVQFRIQYGAAAPADPCCPVASYAWELRRRFPLPVAVVRSGVVTDTSLREIFVWYPIPGPGTTDSVQAALVARTESGTPGDTGLSNIIALDVGDIGPNAPPVQLDTVTLDSLTLHVASSASRLDRLTLDSGFVVSVSHSAALGQTIPDSILAVQRWPFGVYTDTVTLCAVIWSDDRTVFCGCDASRCARWPVRTARWGSEQRALLHRIAQGAVDRYSRGGP